MNASLLPRFRVIFYPFVRSQHRFAWRLALFVACVSGGFTLGQDAANNATEKPAASDSAAEPGEKEKDAAVVYPISVSTAGDGQPLFVVDLELPGVWKVAADGEERTLFYRGPKRFRQPMNRPRCVLAVDDETILVGDSATRDVYRITADEAEPQPLTAGGIGIPMCVVLDPSGETVYVGDAERRVVVRFPINGGDPEMVADINARGLGFDSQGDLWALTPDDPAVVKITDDGTVTPIVSGRPFQYASDLVCVGDEIFVSDGYGKAIFTVTEDGEATKWFEGTPLTHPVGLSATSNAIFVADPHSKQVYRIDRQDPQAKPMLPPQE